MKKIVALSVFCFSLLAHAQERIVMQVASFARDGTNCTCKFVFELPPDFSPFSPDSPYFKIPYMKNGIYNVPNSTSKFRVKLLFGEGLKITWPVISNHTYCVYTSTNLTSWLSNDFVCFVATSNTMMELNDSHEYSKKFYRISVMTGASTNLTTF